MTNTSASQNDAAIEQARAMQPLERQILRALRERGPGLPLEVAVRVLKFPEEIAPALQRLSDRGLIRSERFGGSLLGDELFSITPLGARALEAAEAAERQVGVAAGERVASPRLSTAEREAELLQKLGDIAAASGDTAKAAEYYREALSLVRQLRDAPAP